MISKQISAMLNKQINVELWSAYLYQSMSLDAASKDLSGMAKWFDVQVQEELGHAKLLEEYLNGQNSKVELQAIDAVPCSWNTPLAMMEAALDHEMAITEMINDIMKQAIKEQDFATQSRLYYFVDEQVEEESLFTSMVTKFAECKNEPSLIRELDDKMQGRKREPSMACQGRSDHWL